MPTKVSKWGGKRNGAGRPMTSTVEVCVTIERATLAILTRIAKARGLIRKQGSSLPFLGTAINELARDAKTPEPEYLKLAREAKPAGAA